MRKIIKDLKSLVPYFLDKEQLVHCIKSLESEGAKIYYDKEVEFVVSLWDFIKPETDREWQKLNEIFQDCEGQCMSNAFDQAERRNKYDRKD